MASFSDALEKIKDGMRAQRSGWEGDKWVALQKPDANSKMTSPYLYLHESDGDQVPWVPTHGDLLSDNWEGA
jgi:hypothetical protein